MDAESFDGEGAKPKAQYEVCGKDNGGRSVMWINGGKTEVKDEAYCVRAGMLYWMAVHSDMESLRGGCTFVIDTTNAPNRKVGNERKLQKTWQVRDEYRYSLVLRSLVICDM